jgi:hypothetical protein
VLSRLLLTMMAILPSREVELRRRLTRDRKTWRVCVCGVVRKGRRSISSLHGTS